MDVVKEKTLSDLKAGDEVAYYQDSGPSSPVIRTVKRVTVSQIVVSLHGAMGNEFEVRFRRGSGSVVGGVGGYSEPMISVLTDKLRAKCETARQRRISGSLVQELQSVLSKVNPGAVKQANALLHQTLVGLKQLDTLPTGVTNTEVP